MSTKQLKPSDFLDRPFDSVLKKLEAEIVARNIMAIMNRTGNNWRRLSWDEYVSERKKDGNFALSEKEYFENVIEFCTTPENAILFSRHWGRIE
mgnify:CR=1 FL=1